MHDRRMRGVVELQRDVLAQNTSQHAGHVADYFFHVQRPRLHNLSAAEGQQLPSQAGGSLGSPADLLGALGRTTRKAAASEEQ